MAILVRHLGRVPYAAALELQHRLVDERIAGETEDQLLLLEHDEVFTLGRGADEADLGGGEAVHGIPCIRSSRGGGVTYHGPGQAVAYPIVAVPVGAQDVGRYVRMLEKAILDCVAEFGVKAEAVAGAPGVWVDGRKLASIGIGIRRWVAFHGIALNIDPQLSRFGLVTACRTPGLAVTSLARLCGRPIEKEAVFESLARHLCAGIAGLHRREAVAA